MLDLHGRLRQSLSGPPSPPKQGPVNTRPEKTSAGHQSTPGAAAKDSGEPPTSATLVWASPKRLHGALRSTWEELFIAAKSHFCDPLTNGPDFHLRPGGGGGGEAGRGAALSRQGFSPVQWTHPFRVNARPRSLGSTPVGVCLPLTVLI